MSDYYGAATLEDWLAEEVGLDPTPDTVALFERWRESIEADIEAWMDSADRNGGFPRSWRDWGRGYANIPQSDLADFDEAVNAARFSRPGGGEVQP